MLGVNGCAQQISDQSAALGTELEVHDRRPPEDGYPAAAFQCPHGRTYWILPSAAQIAAWRAADAR